MSVIGVGYGSGQGNGYSRARDAEAKLSLLETKVEQVARLIEAQGERYRQAGNPDSYDPYYEGWDDAMDAALTLIQGVLVA